MLRQVIIQQVMNWSHIFTFHGSQACNVRFFWQFIQFDHSCQGLVFPQTWEIRFNELFGVQTPMIVSRLSERCWDENSSCINLKSDEWLKTIKMSKLIRKIYFIFINSQLATCSLNGLFWWFPWWAQEPICFGAISYGHKGSSLQTFWFFSPRSKNVKK